VSFLFSERFSRLHDCAVASPDWQWPEPDHGAVSLIRRPPYVRPAIWDQVAVSPPNEARPQTVAPGGRANEQALFDGYRTD
jgi:hypothetical protein